MKMWILGAKGQLGAALIHHCSKNKIPFVASDREQADITLLNQLKQLAEKNQCTHVINCAAYTNVDLAEKESTKAHLVNAIGPENLGVIGKEFNLKIVHVSTDYVFDGQKGEPYTETDLPHPLGVYGKTKLKGEELLIETFPKACIVRSSWIFGQSNKNFISSIFSLLKNQEKVRVVSDQINRATYYRDLAKVLIEISDQKGIFHFANEKPLSRYQIVQDFFREMQKRNIPMKCQEIIPISAKDFPALSPRPPYSVLSTDKITAFLGRKPREWETVLSEYLDHASLQS